MANQKIIIRHYAFHEGRTGFTFGSNWTDNPYDPASPSNRKAHRAWAEGWAHQKDQNITVVVKGDIISGPQ